MIRIRQIKLPLEHTEQELLERAARCLRVAPDRIGSLSIVKESVDARKKPDIFFSYVVDVSLKGEREERVAARAGSRDVQMYQEKCYRLPQAGTEPLRTRPVVIGAGPAGLFCALALARRGYRPILLERGEPVDARTERVERFWRDGVLNPSSNVQFGEGGAGTFSDGKLNTLVKDTSGRNRAVMDLLIEFGADPSIRYVSHPHIGTDLLRGIVKRIRQEIERCGGEVRFGCQVTDLELRQGRLAALILGEGERLFAEAAVLAVGHSARDTFEMLWSRGIPMEAKAFAVGLRIQHPQAMINESQYGMAECPRLGPASYKLTAKTASKRGVYSFCMCPGGYVVNASSETGRLAVNGMSYHDRAGENANSALIVTVWPEDFVTGCCGQVPPLAGVAFQRRLEERAYAAAGGAIPLQLYGDFKANQSSSAFGQVKPAVRGRWDFANLRQVLPEVLTAPFLEAMEEFGRKIKGFDRSDAILAGIESRTSSPVRIPRDEGMESAVCGLYPCGEGAGYAGGITSAAMDGLKTAEALIRRYAPSGN